MACIDLNADLGEGAPDDDALMRIVSSCNVACGGHAGDAESMAGTIRLALMHGVAIGAHPSYRDREGFGRRSRFQSGDALYESLSAQVEAFSGIAAELGARVAHLKPHGALYNDAAADAEIADIVSRVTAELPGNCRLVGPPGSELQLSASRHGLGFIAEAFVDRAYGPGGKLVSRSEAGAVLDDLGRITAQALSLAIHKAVDAVDGTRIRIAADTLCIHGDRPGAAAAGNAIRDALQQRGIEICAAGTR